MLKAFGFEFLNACFYHFWISTYVEFAIFWEIVF